MGSPTMPSLPHTLLGVAALLVLLVAPPAVSGLDCFHCTSEEDSQCGDPFYDEENNVRSGDQFLKTCVVPQSSRSLFCSKAVDHSGVVTRGCGGAELIEELVNGGYWTAESNQCYTHIGRGRKCVCSDEGCNGAVGLGLGATLLAVLVVVVM